MFLSGIGLGADRSVYAAASQFRG